MDRVLSGIRPTGYLHLGNYFGALKNFVRMQEENNCYFFIADYHSLTTHPKPGDLGTNIKNVLVDYLAAGLDPEKCTIYIQSDVPEVCELTLLLAMNVYVGELQRVPSFKEKVRRQPNNVNAGLLTYPILMASDILIHRADKVPVGKDQEQHLELTRDFAQRFNHFYGVDYFKLPVAYNFGDHLVKIPGLDGSTKMSKSDNEASCIFLSDSPELIRKKVMKAVSDSGPTEPGQPKSQAVENLFQLMEAVSSPDTLAFFEEAYQKCEIRYGDMKKQLAEDITSFVAPIHERIMTLRNDDDYLRKVAKLGAEKARESASKTVNDVREIIGIRKL
ncbi:tryptophan--tRNA ligase [Bacteroidales bacterium OttesenSCG-928-B11]|nr:tryptophan--tRNA ligase [Bacteroidales bacterium OttesenSCG-928-C03]MDL2313176.1 tryptophan--tRNA ligase [Bacteroidales bacterium OttesenSCG-928-B11]MDL2326225.1 tryptophan--tRNA ligase [Bacteroidales bacterium OttesenSCG-928-A14]